MHFLSSQFCFWGCFVRLRARPSRRQQLRSDPGSPQDMRVRAAYTRHYRHAHSPGRCQASSSAAAPSPALSPLCRHSCPLQIGLAQADTRERPMSGSLRREMLPGRSDDRSWSTTPRGNPKIGRGVVLHGVMR